MGDGGCIAELNSKLGFEYVTNSNGTYRKWNNGFLECWGTCVIATNGCALSIPLPHKYVNTSFSVLASIPYHSPLSGTTMSFSNQNLSGGASFHLYARISTGALPNMSVTVRYYAYGNWR